METTAKLRNLRMSPRKVRLLTDLIKGKSVQDALLQLALQAKDAARPVKKLLESAVANAEHNHAMEQSTLVVKNAFVDAGATLKRFTPRAFGRASAIHKRTAHVTIVLEGEVDEKLKAKNLKAKEEKSAAAESHEGHDHEHEEKAEPKKTTKKAKKAE